MLLTVSVLMRKVTIHAKQSQAGTHQNPIAPALQYECVAPDSLSVCSGPLG